MKKLMLSLALVGILGLTQVAAGADSTTEKPSSSSKSSAHPTAKKGLARKKFHRNHSAAGQKGVVKPGKKGIRPAHKPVKPSDKTA